MYYNPYYHKKKQRNHFFDCLDDNDGDFDDAVDDFFDDCD